MELAGDVKLGVDGDVALPGRGVQPGVVVAGEAAVLVLPGEADHGEEPTSAGLPGSGSAVLTTTVCTRIPDERARGKVAKREVASGDHGRTYSRRSVAC